MHDHQLDCSAARVLPQWLPSSALATMAAQRRGVPHVREGNDPSRRMDLWRGGSPVRGILGWILSAVQVRRVGRGDVRVSLNVLRPGTGDLCSHPCALPRDGITAGPSVRPALSIPTQAGCMTAWQAGCARFHGGGREQRGVPATTRPTPVVALHSRCHARRVYARTHATRTHARGDDNRVW
jgi:hypothetical protein